MSLPDDFEISVAKRMEDVLRFVGEANYNELLACAESYTEKDRGKAGQLLNVVILNYVCSFDDEAFREAFYRGESGLERDEICCDINIRLDIAGERLRRKSGCGAKAAGGKTPAENNRAGVGVPMREAGTEDEVMGRV